MPHSVPAAQTMHAQGADCPQYTAAAGGGIVQAAGNVALFPYVVSAQKVAPLPNP
jgi:hypothetical protein